MNREQLEMQAELDHLNRKDWLFTTPAQRQLRRLQARDQEASMRVAGHKPNAFIWPRWFKVLFFLMVPALLTSPAGWLFVGGVLLWWFFGRGATNSKPVARPVNPHVAVAARIAAERRSGAPRTDLGMWVK